MSNFKAQLLGVLGGLLVGALVFSGPILEAADSSWKEKVAKSGLVKGDIPYALDKNTLVALADVAVGKCLMSGGVGAAPIYDTCGTGGAGVFTTLNATGAVTLDAAVTIGNAAADTLHVFANTITFEGATDNTIETVLAITDPTASDKTITLPDASGAVILSTAGVIDTAAAIWGLSNSLVWEGATADAFETTLTVADPTADVTVTIPAGTGTLMLSAGEVVAGVLNAVSGINNGLLFEGATADDFETTITVTDPTADRTFTFADTPTGTVAIGSATAYRINAVTVTLDGTNPSSVAHGLTTVVACSLTDVRSTAPGADPNWATYVVNGANIDVYAWKVTTGGAAGNPDLVASGDADDVFSLVCVGT